jgi:hypothetical protein
MLLTVAALIRLPSWSAHDATPLAADSFTDLSLLSTGKTFTRAVLGQRRFVAGMLFNERMLEHDRQRDALMAVVLDSDHEVASTHTFDLANTPADIASFLELLQTVKEDHVLCLAVNRSIYLEGNEALAPFIPEIAGYFKGIGAAFTPWKDPACSWILLTLKSRKQWRPLAEYYSDYTGMTLNYSLNKNHRMYSGQPVERLAYVHPSGPQPFHLLDHLEAASVLSPYAIFIPADSLAYPRRDALFIPPRPLPPNEAEEVEKRISWKQFRLGKQAKLIAGVSAITEPGKRAADVTCRILVNDEELVSKTITSTDIAQHSWTDITADLSSYADQTVTLTLMADHSSFFPGVYWGEPQLIMERPAP